MRAEGEKKERKKESKKERKRRLRERVKERVERNRVCVCERQREKRQEGKERHVQVDEEGDSFERRT